MWTTTACNIWTINHLLEPESSRKHYYRLFQHCIILVHIMHKCTKTMVSVNRGRQKPTEKRRKTLQYWYNWYNYNHNYRTTGCTTNNTTTTTSTTYDYYCCTSTVLRSMLQPQPPRFLTCSQSAQRFCARPQSPRSW